jgi:hypothetical protein
MKTLSGEYESRKYPTTDWLAQIASGLVPLKVAKRKKLPRWFDRGPLHACSGPLVPDKVRLHRVLRYLVYYDCEN